MNERHHDVIPLLLIGYTDTEEKEKEIWIIASGKVNHFFLKEVFTHTNTYMHF